MLKQCSTEKKVLGNGEDVYQDLSSSHKNRLRKKSGDFEGIATKRCLSFRPPRTITTDQMSLYEQDQNVIPHAVDNNKRENQENVFQWDPFTASNHQSPNSLQNDRDQNSLWTQRPDKDESVPQWGESFTSWGSETFGEINGTGEAKHGGESLSKSRRPFGVHAGKGQQVEHEQNRQHATLDNNSFGLQDKERLAATEDGQNQKNLLFMPLPKDRSHRQRIKVEREQGRIHTYWGEEEPVGFRGQEAQVEKKNDKSPYLQLNEHGLALRLSESSPTTVMRKTPSGISVSENSASTDEYIRLLINEPHSPNRREALGQHATGTDFIASNRESTVSSIKIMPSTRPEDRSLLTSNTNSSEALQNMMADLPQEGQTSVASNDENFNLSLREISNAAQKHVDLGEFDSALTLYKRILVLYRERYCEIHPLVAALYHKLGMIHAKRADLLTEDKLQQTHVRHKALVCFQAAARTARESLGKEDPNVAVSLVKIGFLHLCSKQYQTALITFREALRIRLINFGGNPHPLIANLHNHLGICLLHLQNFQKSNKQFCKALQIQRQVLDAESSEYAKDQLRVRLLEIADTLENLGSLSLEWLRQKGPQTDTRSIADAQLAEAIEIRSSILGLDHPLSYQVVSLREMIRASSSTYPNFEKQFFADTNTPWETIHKSIVTENSPNAPTTDAPPDIEYIEDSVDSYVVADEESTSGLHAVDVQPIPASDSVCSEFLDQVFDSLPGTLPPCSPRRPWDKKGSDLSALSSLPNERKVPEKNNIYVLQHNIPRHSPIRIKPSQLRDSPSEVADNGDTEFLHSYDIKANTNDSEECCVISSRGEWADFMVPSQLQCGKGTKDREVHVLPHEIVVIRPNTDFSRCIGEPLIQPSTGRKNHGLAKQEDTVSESAYGDDENGNCIAPLSRLASDTSSQLIALTQTMVDNPELHLPEIHAFASMCLKRNRLPEAQQLFITIFNCQRKAVGELHEDVGAALHNVGLAYLRSSDHIQALGYFERAVRIRKGTLGKEHPDVAISQVKVGITLLLMRNFDLALQAFHDALFIRKQALGALHPSNACIYSNIGCIHVEFKELRDAKIAFEAALDMQRNALSLEPTSGHLLLGVSSTLCNLGFLYRCRKMNRKVAVVLREALDLQMCVLGENHPTVLTTMESLADALSLSEVFSQGLWNYSYILSKLSEAETTQDTFLREAVVLYKMAKVHRKENDIEAELEKLNRAQKAAEAMCASSDEEKRTKTELAHSIRAAIQYSRSELIGER